MHNLHIFAMQNAVDIVNSSPHPTNKIAACLTGQDERGEEFSVAATNGWPEIIEKRLGREYRIGNSSGTIHAETACIFKAPQTKRACLHITDPFCPNCAKNMAEAGIARIYIDHKGFDKDFAKRRGAHFDSMSMQICEKAGISIYKVNRKQETVAPILEIGAEYVPADDNPVQITPVDGDDPDADMAELIRNIQKLHATHKSACALARDKGGNWHGMLARFHPVIGYTMVDESDIYDIANPQRKYSFIQEPVNRLLMQAARHGLRIADGYLYCMQVPTSREQVNIVGAGISRMMIANKSEARDEAALEAIAVLEGKAILTCISPKTQIE